MIEDLIVPNWRIPKERRRLPLKELTLNKFKYPAYEDFATHFYKYGKNRDKLIKLIVEIYQSEGQEDPIIEILYNTRGKAILDFLMLKYDGIIHSYRVVGAEDVTDKFTADDVINAYLYMERISDRVARVRYMSNLLPEVQKLILFLQSELVKVDAVEVLESEFDDNDDSIQL